MGLFDLFKRNSGTLIEKASKGKVKNFYSSLGNSNNSYKPEVDFDASLNLFLQDPEVNTAITTRVNAIISSGYTLEGKSRAVKDAKNRLKKLGFTRNFIRRIITNLLLYQNVFIELVRDSSGNVTELHLLETTQMEIKADVHGEIEQFTQLASSGEEISFSPDDIVYITPSRTTTRVWGDNYLRTLYRTVSTKNFIEKFLNYLAETNQWRNIIHVKNMTSDDVKSMLSYYNHVLQDPNEPFVVEGNEEDFVMKSMRDLHEASDFIKLMEHLRTKILMQLKVPPILVGVPDDSNRSNSDAQMKAFNIANESDRDVLSDAFNTDLFKKISLSGVEFVWNPIDKRTEKDDVEIAERLINMGAIPKQVEKFLRNSGLELPEGQLFEDINKQVPPSSGKSMDMYPSRRAEDKQGEINNVGTGEESSTREDQLVSKSKWYYNALVDD